MVRRSNLPYPTACALRSEIPSQEEPVTPPCDTALAQEALCRAGVFDLPPKYQREIAIHEAGHAVTAWLFREEIIHATLVSTAEHWGEVRRVVDEEAAYMIKAGLAQANEIMRKAVISLSGPCAEGLLNGEPNWSDLEADFTDEPNDFSKARSIPGMTERLLSRCYAWTEKTIEHPRVTNLIEALAPGLLASVTLSGDEVDALLRQAWPDTGEWPYRKLGAKWKRWL